jgi:hypothetical protein
MSTATQTTDKPASAGLSTHTAPRLRLKYPNAPVVQYKEAPAPYIIMLFEQFVSDMRKELYKNERLAVKGISHKRTYDKVHFYAETFSITLDFNGGLKI